MKRKKEKAVQPHVTWQQMVTDLNKMGFTYADLMVMLGGAYHTYEKLANGTQKMPRWDTGEKLRRFHLKKMRTQAYRQLKEKM